MALYSAAFTLPPLRASSVSPLFDIRTGPTDYARVMEVNLIVINPSALALSVGLGLSATVGTAKSNSIGLVPYNPNSIATGVTIGVEWSTLPTVPTTFFRRAVIATASTPGKATLVLSGGILMAPSTALSLWVTATGAAALTPIYPEAEVEIDV